MKVFVATKEGQGQRKNDFFWTNVGEFVTFSRECDGESVDGPCGCRRAMSGAVSHKATTTFKVVDLPLTREEYIAEITRSQVEGGGVGQGRSRGTGRGPLALC